MLVVRGSVFGALPNGRMAVQITLPNPPLSSHAHSAATKNRLRLEVEAKLLDVFTSPGSILASTETWNRGLRNHGGDLIKSIELVNRRQPSVHCPSNRTIAIFSCYTTPTLSLSAHSAGANNSIGGAF